ncbi:MAG: hypothetical protein LBI48_10215 [Burkholderiaceae bacterium]|nr:hypothetical protein [Burkholderiaceae bacterium]
MRSPLAPLKHLLVLGCMGMFCLAPPARAKFDADASNRLSNLVRVTDASGHAVS